MDSSEDLQNPREKQSSTQELPLRPTPTAVSVRSRSLLKGRALEESDLLLCPQKGSLTALSQLVKRTEKAVHEARVFLEDALQELGSRRGEDELGPSILTAIQLLHKTLDVWDLAQLGWEDRRQFLSANDQLLGKTEELEAVVRYALHLFHQRERELSTLDQALKIYPQILVFRMSLPPEEEDNAGEGEESSEGEEPNHNNNNCEEIIIKFRALDMQFILIKEEERRELLLQDFSSRTQTELVCIPIYQQIRTLTKAILNVDKAARILEGLKLCGLWELIVPPKRWWWRTPKFGKLEKVVIALLVNRANSSVFSISPLLTGLEARVGKCKDLVSSLHSHLQEREGRRAGKGKKKKGEEEAGDPLRLWIGERLRQAYDEIREEFEVPGGVRREYWSTIRRSLERRRVKE